MNTQIKFVAIGGGESIGASAYLVQVGKVYVLVDFGINVQEPSGIIKWLTKFGHKKGQK